MQKSREVFELADAEAAAGDDDSPLPHERREQEPGDWARDDRPVSRKDE